VYKLHEHNSYPIAHDIAVFPASPPVIPAYAVIHCRGRSASPTRSYLVANV
jgi:hypothetical protein